MPEWPTNQYVEIRNGGYYVAGTRIGLYVIIEEFRRGRSPEAIFESFPLFGSLARVYGAIAFILEHPLAVEAYLKDQEVAWEEFKQNHPLPPDMLERFRRGQKEL